MRPPIPGVQPHHDGAGGGAERVLLQRPACQLQRLPPPAMPVQVGRKRFDGAQERVAQPGALRRDPVALDAGQERRAVERRRRFQQRRGPLRVRLGRCSRQECVELRRVRPHLFQPDELPLPAHDGARRDGRPLQLPPERRQGRAQAAPGLRLISLRPEPLRQLRAGMPPRPVQRHVGQQPRRLARAEAMRLRPRHHPGTLAGQHAERPQHLDAPQHPGTRLPAVSTPKPDRPPFRRHPTPTFHAEPPFPSVRGPSAYRQARYA